MEKRKIDLIEKPNDNLSVKKQAINDSANDVLNEHYWIYIYLPFLMEFNDVYKLIHIREVNKYTRDWYDKHVKTLRINFPFTPKTNRNFIKNRYITKNQYITEMCNKFKSIEKIMLVDNVYYQIEKIISDRDLISSLQTLFEGRNQIVNIEICINPSNIERMGWNESKRVITHIDDEGELHWGSSDVTYVCDVYPNMTITMPTMFYFIGGEYLDLDY